MNFVKVHTVWAYGVPTLHPLHAGFLKACGEDDTHLTDQKGKNRCDGGGLWRSLVSVALIIHEGSGSGFDRWGRE